VHRTPTPRARRNGANCQPDVRQRKKKMTDNINSHGVFIVARVVESTGEQLLFSMFEGSPRADNAAFTSDSAQPRRVALGGPAPNFDNGLGVTSRPSLLDGWHTCHWPNHRRPFEPKRTMKLARQTPNTDWACRAGIERTKTRKRRRERAKIPSLAQGR